MHPSIFGFLFLLTTLLPQPTSAGELTGRPDPEGTPTEVKIQLLLLDLQSVSGADQSFTANFAWAARWKDPRLAHEGPGAKTVSLDEVWNPRLQIINQQRLQKTFPEKAQVSPEGEVSAVQRVWGQFTQPLILHDFPYDQQRMNIDMIGTMHEPGTVVFVQDPDFPSNVSESLSISDWALKSWTAKPVEQFVTRAGRSNPGFNLSLNLSRRHRYHLVNVVLPLLMIIAMSWVVFYIHPKNANPRVSVSVTSMLTLIAYRFAVGASLPKISYLTRMDWFILGASVLVLASLLEVVTTSYLAENNKVDLAEKMNRWMRVIAPVALALIAWASLAG